VKVSTGDDACYEKKCHWFDVKDVWIEKRILIDEIRVKTERVVLLSRFCLRFCWPLGFSLFYPFFLILTAIR
jgi:hypothetical protein